MGHIPANVISKISVLLNNDCNASVSPCTICPLAKQYKLPVQISNSQALLPFELVQCDLWGPYRIPTYNGCKYFVTIVDDYTRHLWTILLPTKQHTIQSIRDFFVHVQTQFHTSIKTFRTDNGGEFMNHDLSSFFASHGTVHQSSCPSTPQQNGRVERKHRNLLEMTGL